MSRIRSRSSVVEFPTTTQTPYTGTKGAFQYYGQTYYVDALPVLAGTPVQMGAQSLGPSDLDLLTQFSRIEDEGAITPGNKIDSIKPVKHVKSEIVKFERVTGAMANQYAFLPPYPTFDWSIPRQWYCTREEQTALPCLIALSRRNQSAYVWPSGQTIYKRDTVDTDLPDRLPQVPARLVKKLDDLHLVNTAWEARELPDLANMLGKRNRLSTKEGLEWIRAFATDRTKYKMMRALSPKGFAPRMFVDWLRENQLGYSFGLAPTVGEVRSICESLKKGPKKRNFRTTATIVQDRKYDQNVMLDGLPSPVVSGRMSETVTVRRVDGVRATYRRPKYNTSFFNNTIPMLLGHNPANMIWAAIPWSWAVDLILNIDDVLDSLWCQSQTEYDLEYWSSLKVLSDQTFSFRVRDGFGGTYPPNNPPLESYHEENSLNTRLSDYSRTPRMRPDASSAVRPSLNPKMVLDGSCSTWFPPI